MRAELVSCAHSWDLAGCFNGATHGTIQGRGVQFPESLLTAYHDYNHKFAGLNPAVCLLWACSWTPGAHVEWGRASGLKPQKVAARTYSLFSCVFLMALQVSASFRLCIHSLFKFDLINSVSKAGRHSGGLKFREVRLGSEFFWFKPHCFQFNTEFSWTNPSIPTSFPGSWMILVCVIKAYYK